MKSKKELKKMNRNVLRKIGCTEQALELYYDNSMHSYYEDDNGDVYEFNDITGDCGGNWQQATFVQWFNEM